MKEPTQSGLDALGLGEFAKAIPPEAYIRASNSIFSTFDSLVAPITHTTQGLGEFIKAKFQNMTERERALGVYALEQACRKAAAASGSASPPFRIQNFKSFVRAFEEVSKEPNQILNEMWTNLIAAELVSGAAHPHFVELLTHFSPAEAKLLNYILDYDDVGYHGGRFMLWNKDRTKNWIRHSDETVIHEWTSSCILLVNLSLADVLAAKNSEKEGPCLFYRTATGTEFIKVVTNNREPKHAEK